MKKILMVLMVMISLMGVGFAATSPVSLLIKTTVPENTLAKWVASAPDTPGSGQSFREYFEAAQSISEKVETFVDRTEIIGTGLYAWVYTNKAGVTFSVEATSFVKDGTTDVCIPIMFSYLNGGADTSTTTTATATSNSFVQLGTNNTVIRNKISYAKISYIVAAGDLGDAQPGDYTATLKLSVDSI